MILAQITSSSAPTVGLWAIFISAALTDNILLTRFLGMCPFLAVSRKMKPAIGLGLAVPLVTTFTVPLNAILFNHVLEPLELGISLKLIVFIVVIAAFVQLMEMLIERISLTLYYSLGIFLPLITVNCAILGTSLFMVSMEYTVLQALIFGFASGMGWTLAIMMMAGIRERLKNSPIPPALEGPGIALITTGIMALAFIAFSGMIQQ